MYQPTSIKLSMLVPSRPNSKFLAHLVMAFLNKTSNFYDTELVLMPAATDEWNKDLLEYISKNPSIKIVPENLEMGQKGHHLYLNEMAKYASGDWMFNFCDDMNILAKGWDEGIRNFIRKPQLDPDKCYMLIPRFKVTGAVEHILSRGWIETVGFVAGYQNTDSWLNTVTDTTPEEFRNTRRLELTDVMFEDYSNDRSMDKLMELQERPDNVKKVENALRWEDEAVQEGIKVAANKLWEAYLQGR